MYVEGGASFILAELQVNSHGDCLSRCSVHCVILSLCLSLLEKVQIIYMPPCVTVFFFFFSPQCRMSKYYYGVSCMITVQQEISFLRRAYFVRHTYVSAKFAVCLIFICLWSIKFDKSIQQLVPACLFPIWHYSTNSIVFVS